METWDVLNKEGQRTGRTVVRGNRGLTKGEYHLVVHIWVVNSEGKLLLQRRSDSKLLMAGEWAAIGGSALSGEGSRHAAIRELSEEMGIRPLRKQMVFMKRMVRKFSINDIWAVKYDCDASTLRLQADEVAQAKWATLDELLKMVDDGDFHNYGSQYFEAISEIPEFLKGRR